MLEKYAFLVQFTLAHPRLAFLAWRLKRSGRTYLGYWHLFSLARNYFEARSRRIGPVRVAEFGVGRGGSATLLAWLVQHYGGALSLYDVFGRIPAPSEADGHRAQDRYRVITQEEDAGYYGNMQDLLTTIRSELSEVCEQGRLRFVQGSYQDTLPAETCEPYDVVHIDCDWYESVCAVLAFLRTHLATDAIIQVDDYSNWQGSRMAVDEAEWLQPYGRRLIGGPLVVDMGVTSS